MANYNVMKMIVAFVERGHGPALCQELVRNQIPICFRSMGVGTASSELLDVLGLGTSEREVIIAIGSARRVEKTLDRLDHELRGKVDIHGILFDMPLTGLNSRIVTGLLAGEEAPVVRGGEEMAQSENSLILVTVNQGHTDAVMDTARSAGAAGGTILRARWAGDKDPESLWGINIQEEKEIIAIVADKEKRNAIMETIHRIHGLQSKEGAVVCSLGIDRVLRG